MGLYDSYRLSNSTAIPQFAGSVLPEMAAAKKELDLNYDTAKDMASRTGNALATTPYFQNSAKEFRQVHDDISGKLGQITGRKDYENMVPLTQELAQEAATKLKPFVAEQARWQDWVKGLDDKDKALDSTTKQKLIAKAIDDDKEARKGGAAGLTPDPITGELKGGFQPPSVAKHVDLPEWADKVLKNMAVHEWGGEWVSTGDKTGGYIMKNGQRIKTLTQAQVRSTLESAYNLSPDVEAYVKQQAGLTGWEFGRNAVANYSRMDEDTKKDVDAKMAQGYTRKQAVTMLMGLARERQIKSNMSTFSDKYIVNDEFRTKDVSADGEYGRRAKAAADAKEAAGYAGQGSTEIDNPEIQTPKGLTDALAARTQEASTAYENLVAAQAQLNKGGNSPQSKAKLQTDIKTFTNQYTAAKDKTEQYRQIQQENLDDASKALFNAPYSVAMKDSREGIDRAMSKDGRGTFVLTKFVKGTSGGSDYTAKAGTITQGEVIKQLEKGNAKIDQFGKSIILEDGRSLNFDGWNKGGTGIKDAIQIAATKNNQIRLKNERDYKPQGFVTNSAVIPEKDWKDGVVPLLKNMGATDASGNKVLLDDKDIDWSKTERGVYNSDGNYIPVTLMSHDGKEVGKYKMDATSTNIRGILGKKFYESGSTEEIKRIGEDMLTEMPQRVREAFPRNSYRTTAANGNPYVVEINGKEQEVQMSRRADNLFVISDMEGKELKRTSSHSQAGRWLDALERDAAEQSKLKKK